MFDDDFISCMDKSYEEIEADIKSYSTLTVVQGKIRLQPGTKCRIKAIVQWVRYQIRTDVEPGVGPLPILDVALLTRGYKSHANFLRKTATMTTIAVPAQFLPSIQWDD